MSSRSRPVTQLGAVNRFGHQLIVEFYWLGDRYGHTIACTGGGERRDFLESLEGDCESSWPSSPPLQHLSDCAIQSDSQRGQVTMLVGAAGKSHWSMCVSTRYHTNELDATILHSELVFDVACRIKETPYWLGNSYRARAGQVAISDTLGLVCVPVNPPSCVVIPDKAHLELETCAEMIPIVRCKAPSNITEAPPETIRWQYSVRLVDD